MVQVSVSKELCREVSPNFSNFFLKKLLTPDVFRHNAVPHDSCHYKSSGKGKWNGVLGKAQTEVKIPKIKQKIT